MPHVHLQELTEMVQQRGQPYRVLIVDDEQWMREVFSDFCKLSDAFEVEVAASGVEAVLRIEQDNFDLVTLDLIMPEMSGLDVLSEIKRVSPKLPVMIVTGNATEKLVKKAGVLGACRVMYKPVRIEHFLSEVISTLKKQ